MENNFYKRLRDLKNAAFRNIQEIDLDTTANKKTGYYSLKTIETVLVDLLEKYDIDYDIVWEKDEMTLAWFDCQSDKIRTVRLHTSKISKIGRLPAMSNEVQSFGAEITYMRRYMLTMALNLNATDVLENNTGKKATIYLSQLEIDSINKKYDKEVIDFVIKNSNYNNLSEIPANMKDNFLKSLKGYQDKKDAKDKEKEEKEKIYLNKEQTTELLKLNNEILKDVLHKNKIPNVFSVRKNQYNDIYNEVNYEIRKKQNEKHPTQEQIKRLYTIATNNNISQDDVKKFIGKKYNKISTKDLNIKEYEEVCKRLEVQKQTEADKYNNIPAALPQ